MPKVFDIYVPGEYTFENYFLPKIKNSTLDCFEVDKNRHGVQRKGNNHLIVFLDFHLKKPSLEFTKINGDQVEDFFIEEPADIELFNRVLGREKEVAVFSLSYHARMSVIAWEVLLAVADNEKVVVEDDLDKLMDGPKYVRDLKKFLGQV